MDQCSEVPNAYSVKTQKLAPFHKNCFQSKSTIWPGETGLSRVHGRDCGGNCTLLVKNKGQTCSKRAPATEEGNQDRHLGKIIVLAWKQ